MIGIQDDFKQLIRALKKASEPVPNDLQEAIEALPRVGKLPHPASAWLLIFLVQYRQHQIWAKRMLKEHLPEYVAATEDFEELPEGTIIPGMPEWEIGAVFCRQWGVICSRVTGENITVSLASADDERNVIVPGPIVEWLRSPSPWEPAGRLMAFAPDTVGLAQGVAPLGLQGLLQIADSEGNAQGLEYISEGMFILSPLAVSLTEPIFAFCRRWETAEHRPWLAALIGDWRSADELAVDVKPETLRRHIAGRARTFRRQCLARARKALDEDPQDVRALRDLAVLEAEDYLEYAERAYRQRKKAPATEEYLAKIEDPRWCPCLYDLFCRFSKRRPPDIGGALTCAPTLLKYRHHTREVVKTLAGFGTQGADAAAAYFSTALVLLKLAPDMAFRMIRRSLQEEPPAASKGRNALRTNMAVALATIDEPWSRRELTTALEAVWQQSENPEDIVFLVLALEESQDPQTKETAKTWADRVGREILDREGCWFQERCAERYEDYATLRGHLSEEA
jgi:hypothetical protein